MKLARSWLLFSALTLQCVIARAEGVPSWFVPEDKCMSRDCTCDDMPMIDAFRDNQQNARDAWMSVKNDIGKQDGPKSLGDAVKLFQSRFMGDPRIVDQFETCSTFDASKNNANKIAGVTGLGQAALDPCFCETFCKDIVQSTIDHEKMHVPTLILGTLNKAEMIAACKLGIAPDVLCTALDPWTLADSELASHDAGLATLDAARSRIPSESDVDCTWEPLPAAPQTQRAVPAPSGFMARLRSIIDRILHGAAPSESLAMLDARGR
jgi:hypothetical protein